MPLEHIEDTAVEESLRNKRLYKVFVVVLKALPLLLALVAALNTILSFFAIDLIILSYIGSISLLSLLFLYLSSYVFNFCAYHRIFLDYAVINNIIDVIDLYIGIPITNLGMLCVQMMILFVVLVIALILYLKKKHSK